MSINRLRFRHQIRSNQSGNVVDGMVKARALYKELAIKAHTDRHPDNPEVAEDIMQRITANRFDYTGLIAIQKEIKEKLS